MGEGGGVEDAWEELAGGGRRESAGTWHVDGCWSGIRDVKRWNLGGRWEIDPYRWGCRKTMW